MPLCVVVIAQHHGVRHAGTTLALLRRLTNRLNSTRLAREKALLALAFVVSGPLAALGLAPLWAWLVCAAGIAVATLRTRYKKLLEEHPV